ncbi:retrovirus-related pol polyprotein from transposon TNT 1-94 [Tanacetum coccineum]
MPYLPCTHCGFNDHRPDDYRNYHGCEICGNYEVFTSEHNRVIQIRGGVLDDSSQSIESSIRVSYTTCRSSVHSTTNHNDFEYFKRGEKLQATKAKELIKNGCSRSMTGVKSYLHKYVEQPGPKDKPCSAHEKGKHKRASFKTKQNFAIRKCLHLLYMDLFGPVSPMSINHEKFTLVIVDKYSRLNKTLIEAARTMLNGSVLSKHFWTETIRDHLGKFDAKADDGYFLGYSFNSKAFRVFNIRRQQIEETYPPDEFIQEDDPSRQYQTNSNISYYIIPYGHSLTELTQEKHVPEVIAPNEQDNPQTENVEGPRDPPNTKDTQELNFQNEQINHQSTEETSGINTKILVSITKFLAPKVFQSQDTNQASTSSYPVAQDRWSKDQHIELVNIISDHGEGMLTRSMAAKLTSASASECLFADFLSEIEPKKVSEALKHPGWIVAMQEEQNQLHRNKVWTLVPLPYRKIAIGSKWVFRNKKDKHGIVTKNRARLVAQGYSQEEGIDYDETFAPVARMEAIRIFLAFATYMNFIVFQIDVKIVFLNGKLKEEVYVKQPSGFESNEFPNYVCKLDKTLYGLKQAPKQHDKGISICQEQYTRNLLQKYETFDSFLVKTQMVPPNNIGPDLTGKLISVQSKRITSYCCEKNLQVAERKSTSGACQILTGKLDCQSAKKQQPLSMSSTEAEYIAATSAIAISNNPVLHSRIKHIDIRYHFIKDHILKGYIGLHFIHTEYQLVDIFTKPMDEPSFTRLKADYPQSALAYKEICKFLMNCPLVEDFTRTPSLIYQNFLKEFRCTAIAYDPNLPANDSEVRLLKEFKIKFSVMNGKKPLTLDFKTFTKSTGLNYYDGTYVSHPSFEAVKAELAKIVEKPILLDMAPVLKTTFLVAWMILFTFVIQVLGGNYSSSE